MPYIFICNCFTSLVYNRYYFQRNRTWYEMSRFHVVNVEPAPEVLRRDSLVGERTSSVTSNPGRSAPLCKTCPTRVSLNSSEGSVDTALTDDSPTRPLIAPDTPGPEPYAKMVHSPHMAPKQQQQQQQQQQQALMANSVASLTSNGLRSSRKYSTEQHVEFDCSPQPSIRRNGTWVLDFETSLDGCG